MKHAVRTEHIGAKNRGGLGGAAMTNQKLFPRAVLRKALKNKTKS